MALRPFAVLGITILVFQVSMSKTADTMGYKIPRNTNKPESHTEKEEIEEFRVIESHVGGGHPSAKINKENFDTFDILGKKYLVFHNEIQQGYDTTLSSLKPISDRDLTDSDEGVNLIVKELLKKIDSKQKASQYKQDHANNDEDNNLTLGSNTKRKDTKLQQPLYHRGRNHHLQSPKLQETKAPLVLLLIEDENVYQLSESPVTATARKRIHKNKPTSSAYTKELSNRIKKLPERSRSPIKKYPQSKEPETNNTNSNINKLGLFPRLVHFFVYHPVLTGFFIAIDIVLLIVLIAVMYICVAQQCQTSPPQEPRRKSSSSLDTMDNILFPNSICCKSQVSVGFPNDATHERELQSNSSSELIKDYASLQEVVASSLPSPKETVDIEDTTLLQERSLTTGQTSIDDMLIGKTWTKSTFRNFPRPEFSKSKDGKLGYELKDFQTNSKLSVASLAQRLSISAQKAEKLYRKPRR